MYLHRTKANAKEKITKKFRLSFLLLAGYNQYQICFGSAEIFKIDILSLFKSDVYGEMTIFENKRRTNELL